MTKTLTLAAIGLLALPTLGVAQTAGAITVTDEQVEIVRAAIEDAGCTIIDDETAAVVENATGYDEILLEAVVARLRVYDEIVDADEGGITMISGACAT